MSDRRAQLAQAGAMRNTQKQSSLYCLCFADKPSLSDAVQRLAVGENTQLLPISTCQRHELFVLSPDRTDFLSDHLLCEQGDAAERLFRLAAGELSDIPGETAIHAQLQTALRTACRERFCGEMMTRLTRRALRTGEAIRDRMRETTPIIELPDLIATVARLSEPNVILLGAGPIARQIKATLLEKNIKITTWATRRPHHHRGATSTLSDALNQLNSADIIIAAVANRAKLFDATDLPSGTITIDLATPGNIVNPTWTMQSIIETHNHLLNAQRDALGKAAHRIPALAQAALAETLCPSLAGVARSITRFREAIIDAELNRLEPMLSRLDQAEAEKIRRSIRHTAARSVHPVHEYVNQLGRQNRADEAALLVDHLLGSRVGWSESTT